MNPTTTAVHRRIEQIAAELLDALPDVEFGASEKAEAQRFAAMWPDMDTLASRAAERTSPMTAMLFECGPNLAIIHATITDVLLSPMRPPWQWCPHRDSFFGEQVVCIPAMRAAGCPSCALALARLSRDRLATDHRRDVCGVDSNLLTPRALPFAAAVVSMFTGSCCDPLFDYAVPLDFRTFNPGGAA